MCELLETEAGSYSIWNSRLSHNAWHAICLWFKCIGELNQSCFPGYCHYTLTPHCTLGPFSCKKWRLNICGRVCEDTCALGKEQSQVRPRNFSTGLVAPLLLSACLGCLLLFSDWLPLLTFHFCFLTTSACLWPHLPLALALPPSGSSWHLWRQ